MFTDLLTYSGIVTKTKAMEARLISIHDYESISNLTSVTDFINFLKVQPSYKDLFAGCDERLLHRNEIEHIINNALYLDYAKLFRFANGKQRGSLDLLFFRYEVNILKSCLQNLFSKDPGYDLSLFEPFFQKHSHLDIRKLSGSETLDEFINYLKDTPYFDLFRHIQQTTDGTLYDFEVQLDIFYYMTIWKLRKRVSRSKDQKAFTDIIGKEIDFLNMMWIYRSKKYYDVDSTHIYSSIIPIHYKLKSNELMNMIESATLEEFISVMESTYYHSENADMKDTHFSMESLFYQKRNHLYRVNMKKYPNSMCTIHHFLFMKELEIDRLTTSLECIRYGLEPADTLNYILK
ncbi:MAG: V-type ATPase subunit [Acetivibrio sp.]